MTATLDFGGEEAPPQVNGGTLLPLGPDRKEVDLFGRDQDRPGEEIGPWLYRLTLPNAPALGNLARRTLAAVGRGQTRLARLDLPPGVFSGWSEPVTTELVADSTPQPPVPLEIPLWTSLPDSAGVGRARLAWAPLPTGGYILYTATESAVRGALALPGNGHAAATDHTPGRIAPRALTAGCAGLSPCARITDSRGHAKL